MTTANAENSTGQRSEAELPSTPLLEGWQTGTPPVKEYNERTFWCAVRDRYKRLRYVPLEYRNRYIAELSEDCYEVPEGAEPVHDDPDGEYYWTGWFQNWNDETFHEFDGEVLAWVDLPRDFPTSNAGHDTRSEDSTTNKG